VGMVSPAKSTVCEQIESNYNLLVIVLLIGMTILI
jgi:hypothetical protein